MTSAAYSHRRIIVVGYTYEADALPVLDAQGLPSVPVSTAIRMMVAFWVPQKEPFRRRPVGTHAEFLKSEIRKHARASGLPPPDLLDVPATLAEYVQKFGLHNRVLYGAVAPGFTMVPDATSSELEMLRAGVIEEQLQDFTFPRQPTAQELRDATLTHWEQRALRSLGSVPNVSAAGASPLKPVLTFESV